MHKKILWALLITFMILVSGFAAMALVPIGVNFKSQTTLEEPFYSPYTREQVLEQHQIGMDSLTDESKMKVFSRGTKIGGATCSLFPDKRMDIDYGSFGGKICFLNEDHVGKVITIFDVTSGYWVHEGSIELTQRDKQCIDVMPDKKYVVETYYCDIIEDTSCIDTDSDTLGLPGDYEKYGEVTVIGSVQGSETIGDYCDDNWLQERLCDSDQTMISKSVDCEEYKEGYICSHGRCHHKDASSSITGSTIAGDTTQAKSGKDIFQGLFDFISDLWDAIFG